MSGYYNRKRHEQIDSAVNKADTKRSQSKPKKKAKKKTEGGMGASSIEAIMERLAKERNKKGK